MCALDGASSGWANDPYRGAGGRRRFNRERQMRALERRLEVARLIQANGLHRGAQARMARQLGVSESTIGRDVQAIFGEHDQVRCPCCGTAVPSSAVTWSWRPHRAAGSAPLRLVVSDDDD
jgi:hypothetical protein